MKRKQGFTLVELLVVMAIIAILASIVVPNVQRYIVRARLTRAVAEISGIELSLTAIMTDAGRGNMSQLFRRDAAPQMGWPTVDAVEAPGLYTKELFEAAADVYGRVAYDLLRLGRDCLSAGTDTVAQNFIQHDILAKLGTNYMDVGLDSWGQIYRVWPGPWRFATDRITPAHRDAGVTRWPIPFRIFSVDTGQDAGSQFAVQRDPFTLRGNSVSPNFDGVQSLSGVILDPETWPTQVGLPAQANKSVFIWSYGQNNRSSQMLYSAEYALVDPWQWYYTESEEDIAGGDDVNNWDSGTSWQRFYM